MNAHPEPLRLPSRPGDRETLFRGHVQWLRRAVHRRFGEAVSPDDIVQEAYLRVPDETAIRHPRALLLKIASRLAIDQLRRERHAAAYAQAQEVQDHVSAPEQDQSLLLKQLLSGLPSVCRETFLLSRFEGLSYSKDGQGLAKVGPKALLESALRMRPDRILLQELRDGSAWFYLRQCNSGHPGSITTVHADSAALAFEQVTLLVRESDGGRDLPREEIRSLLGLLVDVVVQLRRVDGRFGVSEVHYRPRAREAPR